MALRKILVEDNQLEGVIKLPAGVFKPYAGVSTAILIFTKGGNTTDVFFYDVQADGFSLDDKRLPVAENDLPDVRERWKARNPKKDKDRTDKAFFVPKKEIVANKYDLSLNRYREIVHEEVEYEAPEDDHRSPQESWRRGSPRTCKSWRRCCEERYCRAERHSLTRRCRRQLAIQPISPGVKSFVTSILPPSTANRRS